MIKKHFFLIVFILLQFITYSQNIELSKSISDNKIVAFSNQKLILLDFWATWCGPCIPATTQLEYFQESNKSKVFVISISDENQEKVETFLLKHPIKLMVALDLDKINIHKYNIESRPYSVLFNLNGDMLWKGHPSDLTTEMLNKFYDKNSHLEQVDFTKIVKFNEIIKPKSVQPEGINIKEVVSDDENFELTTETVFFSGKISKLVSKLKTVLKTDVEIKDKLNKNIELNCSLSDWKNTNKILDLISNQFNLTISDSKKTVTAQEIEFENKQMLWDKNQLKDFIGSNYIIGSDRIVANDLTIKEMALVLSEAKSQYFVYKGEFSDQYDWDFQYLYDNLMIEELESSFGIKLKAVTTDVSIVIIDKKKE